MSSGPVLLFQPGDRRASSYEALVEECVFMGWPKDPSRGRERAKAFLSSARLPLSDSQPLDLYAALNQIRSHSWTYGSELWSAYVDSRRAEILSAREGRRYRVTLTRSMPVKEGRETQRLRLPLPLSHPTHPAPTWRLEAVYGDELERRESPGALDISIRPASDYVQARISYEAHIVPQLGPSDSADRSIDPDLSCPFRSPSELSLSRIDALRALSSWDKMRSIWDIFHNELRSGHIYHDEHMRDGRPLDAASVRWFDCVAGTWLLVKAATSLGLSTRLFSGLILNSFGPSQHYWCEVLLDDGWYPFDLYAWDIRDSTEQWRHIFFGSLDCRLRFELLPHIHSRFLPHRPWLIERRITPVGARYVYRDVDNGSVLGNDLWALAL